LKDFADHTGIRYGCRCFSFLAHMIKKHLYLPPSFFVPTTTPSSSTPHENKIDPDRTRQRFLRHPRTGQ
jgi:hypothetical protein